jgi:hypothetical protein
MESIANLVSIASALFLHQDSRASRLAALTSPIVFA